MNVDCKSLIYKEDLLAKFKGNHDTVQCACQQLQADVATFVAAATMSMRAPLPSKTAIPRPPADATLSLLLPLQKCNRRRCRRCRLCHSSSRQSQHRVPHSGTHPTSNTPPHPFSSFARQGLSLKALTAGSYSSTTRHRHSGHCSCDDCRRSGCHLCRNGTPSPPLPTQQPYPLCRARRSIVWRFGKS